MQPKGPQAARSGTHFAKSSAGANPCPDLKRQMAANDNDVIDVEFSAVSHDDGCGGEPGRALIAIGSPQLVHAAVANFRPDSSFVAHLIAGAANAPQTRKVRRASPEDALASYRSSAARQQSNARLTGRTTSRVA